MPSAARGLQDYNVQPAGSLALDSARNSILGPIPSKRSLELQFQGNLNDWGDAVPSGVSVNHVRFAEAPA